ncbi:MULTISPECIES: Rieske 2Fe-2S domain-containing protein [unclassified Paenibacillus]|uniref:Rieske 2Fe-2S domain-containing protein n=1 Tax=unclassified Paenibacillus TaxID=185978 RepID=UPI001AE7FF60|nr:MULTISPECIES: Rieske 2Fe-2S domain-containing protein [unclassified Paenibacillus]MBP1155399.1 phenylpropionate dioxygenase-like ring-hydroxylating dioxygenase large terminal subunit [Paenibacillus sp. PvP091]MBP1169216.1 phenylpropionate dioxygenase-like ring-hydroxylating dioxygenase large terminal subunit [Paenibacillus sp. PvR098]MBP2440244.1 phenylpropionate dioxygenase-like ring-hydroxylating dioxygenase large terminal subunit [Paenibacillus sp. PvP052]
MLSKEKNELLTRTGPGTPAGEVLRSCWQPVALSKELPIDGAPLPVRIMGEDLVLFRNEEGVPGLLGIHCAHRGADLSYGRVENGGLRCIYHGWLFDSCGSCLEIPAEPAGSNFRKSIRQPSYPVVERGEIIFGYLGAGEPPAFPDIEVLNVPESHRYVSKYYCECNYLQGNEGNIDPSHSSYLHRIFDEGDAAKYKVVKGGSLTANDLQGKDVAPTIETEKTEFGLRVYTVRDMDHDKMYLKVSNYVFPNFSAVPGPTVGDGYIVNWHVPIDDTHHWRYSFIFRRSQPIEKEWFLKENQETMHPNFMPVRNRENRYLQDREEMKTKTYSGVGTSFAVHDVVAIEGMGPVQDRTQEHLTSADKVIIQARQVLEKAIIELKENKNERSTKEDHNLYADLRVVSEVLPKGTDFKAHFRSKYLDV